MKNIILAATAAILVAGCSSTSLIATHKKLPPIYVDFNATHQIKSNMISLFRLHNYTDTPRAGLRAANIAEGVLLAKGYNVISHLSKNRYTLKEAINEADKDDAKYCLIGGVSEWRYKTGIDGEPAVSLQLSLYEVENEKLVWSATGADSDWGNSSIGTTAQNLIETMLAK